MATTTVNGAPAAPQNNQYDLQRQRVRDEEAKNRKLQQEAMQRSLAGRGFAGGTGFAEAQTNKADIEAREGERQRLGGIDIAEAGAEEQRAEAERARTWQTGERVGSQEFAGGQAAEERKFQTGEREGTQTWQASQNAEVNRLTERRLTAEEQAEARRMGLSEDQFAEQKLQNVREYGLSLEESNQRQLQIDDAAAQAQSKLDFDYWSKEAGFADADRERAWQERQGALEREEVSAENREAREFQLSLSGYQDLLTRGRMELQDTLETNQAAVKTRTDLMYQYGVSNTPVDTTNLTQLEKDSYEMGKSGRGYEDMQKYISDQTTLRNQIVLTLAEAPELKDDITAIWKEFDDLINPSALYGQGG